MRGLSTGQELHGHVHRHHFVAFVQSPVLHEYARSQQAFVVLGWIDQHFQMGIEVDDALEMEQTEV